MFQPCLLKEPPHLKGYDVGELEIKGLKSLNLHMVVPGEQSAPNYYLRIRSPVTTPSQHTTKFSQNTFDPDWSDETPLKFRITHRYQTGLRVEV